MQKYKSFFGFILFFLMLNCIDVYADTIRTTGDILQIALPAIGLTTAVLTNDSSLIKESISGMAVNAAITQSLKYSINRTRPDGGDLSFPSGHTSSAFHGAAFVDMNYGSKVGLTAYTLATIVAYSRVRANRHYISDVVAGAIVGIYSAKFAKENMSLSSYKDEDVTWIKFSVIY